MSDPPTRSRATRGWLGRRARRAVPPPPQTAYDVVAVAASAGGLAAVSEFLSGLPGDLPAALLVVQHLDPHHPSLMASILQRRTPLVVKEATEGDAIRGGVVYVAPPDRHLLVTPEGALTLSRAELVHFLRPSADLLFESVASSYGQRALFIIITGTGGDGAAGVQAAKRMGGTVIVQDPATSEFPGMPTAAVRTGCADHTTPLSQIAALVVKLVTTGEAA